MTATIQQPRLLDSPMVGLSPIQVRDANRLLTAWGHRLGPCNRPFTQQAFALELDGSPISMAISASIVNGPVGGYARTEVVECARLCSAPGYAWASRIMLRLWREVCGPRWPDWAPQAAVSYSQNAHHRGDLYRFDGWSKIKEDCGATTVGGTGWSQGHYATTAALGKKTLWLWRYDAAPRGGGR